LNLIEKNTALVKKTASELGFSFCGIAEAVQLDEDARRLETWLNQHKQGKMQYLRISRRNLKSNSILT
jgi:epoxyqueuosine reductase